MTTEVQNSDLYLATATLVENVFESDIKNVTAVSTVVTDIFDLPDYSLGSITNLDGEVLIQLGKDELNQFTGYFGFTEDSKPTIYRYVAASMFAGYLIASSVVGRDREFSEASEVFNQYLIDDSRVVSIFEDCAWRSFGSPEAPETIFKSMSEKDPVEIATLNMQRVGSGIVLLAEERLGLDSMRNVRDEMVEALNENIFKQTKYDQLTLAAAGFSSMHAKAKIGHNVMERLIKQRGIGLAFPSTETEIHELNEDLYTAQKSADAREFIVRSELADEQNTSTWQEMIDLSGGYAAVDLEHMKVQQPKD